MSRIYTPHQIRTMFQYIKAGEMSILEISRTLGINKAWISYVGLKHFNEDGYKKVPTPKRGGRRKSIPPVVDEEIGRLVRENPKLSAREIKKHLASKGMDVPVSRATLNRAARKVRGSRNRSFTDAQREGYVEQYRASGLSIRQFCIRTGIEQTPMQQWVKKFTRPGKSSDMDSEVDDRVEDDDAAEQCGPMTSGVSGDSTTQNVLQRQESLRVEDLTIDIPIGSLSSETGNPQNSKSGPMVFGQRTYVVSPWPQIVLFGDSHFQNAFSSGCTGIGNLIAAKFQRRCDILTRGFTGYNTRLGRCALDHFLPEIQSSKTAAFVILFGSNDSCSEGDRSHLDLQEYSNNLTYFIRALKDHGIPPNRIILVSPPPSNQEAWAEDCQVVARTISTRDNDVIEKYALSAGIVAGKQGTHFADAFTAIMNCPEWKSHLADGWHLNGKGSAKMYSVIAPLLDLILQSWKHRYPDWKDIDPDNPEIDFRTFWSTW